MRLGSSGSRSSGSALSSDGSFGKSEHREFKINYTGDPFHLVNFKTPRKRRSQVIWGSFNFKPTHLMMNPACDLLSTCSIDSKDESCLSTGSSEVSSVESRIRVRNQKSNEKLRGEGKKMKESSRSSSIRRRTESSGVYLRLVIDEEKNKVVLAEAGKDFIEVLFSFLTLPMGTIARLLEKHRKSQPVTVGCFNNLYRSVVDMGIDNFETEACKQMLMYPMSVSDVQNKRLKLKINPIEGNRYFTCPRFSYCNLCSNYSTTRCRCGSLTKEEIQVSEVKVVENKQHGEFISGGSTFIITDDLEVAVKSTGLVLEKLKSLGCADISKLGEKFVSIGLKEVLTLLQCIFSSNTPLTDTFLNTQSPQGVTKIYETVSQCMEKKDEAEPEKVLTLNAVVRKQDMKILLVDCEEDFVELLFSFLAVPLESVWEISDNNISLGCIANFCRSLKDLSASKGTIVSASKCVVLPSFYSFQVQLPSITTLKPPVYYRYKYSSSGSKPVYALTKDCNKLPYYRDDKLVPVTLLDPKSHGNDQSRQGVGFLKKETRFTVSDDLIITPMNSCSTVCLLKKLNINAEDLEVHVISISKAEALNLLRASLVTSSALNTALCHLIAKKRPLCETPLRRSQRNKLKETQSQ